MRLPRRASLLVALSLLVPAATAYAASEWVLWLKKDYDAAVEGQWSLIQAFVTRQDCIAALGETFTQASDGQTMATRESVRGSFLVIAPYGRASTAAMCLPDTVDPRGPKGGGR